MRTPGKRGKNLIMLNCIVVYEVTVKRWMWNPMSLHAKNKPQWGVKRFSHLNVLWPERQHWQRFVDDLFVVGQSSPGQLPCHASPDVSLLQGQKRNVVVNQTPINQRSVMETTGLVVNTFAETAHTLYQISMYSKYTTGSCGCREPKKLWQIPCKQ